MSWKPCRGSGLMFDKYSKKSDENREKYSKMLENNEYLKFENLNKFSKYLYLYWLNENKKRRYFNSRHKDLDIELFASYSRIIPMLKNNLEYVYKPLIPILTTNAQS